MTRYLRSWLSNLGWSEADLQRLDGLWGEEFLGVLFLQTYRQANWTVLNHFPSSSIAEIHDSLITDAAEFVTVKMVISTEDDPEYEELPPILFAHFLPRAPGTFSLGIYFIGGSERDTIRARFFPQGLRMTRNLTQWLQNRGWPGQDLAELQGLDPHDEESFLLKVLSLALTNADYILIQSLPRKYGEPVLSHLTDKIKLNEGLSEFLTQYRI